MNRRRQIQPSPAVDFPVYGLDASWPGSRWLESFGEAIGDPIQWVSLGHQSLDGESLVFVMTFSGPRADAQIAKGEQPLRHVASHAATVLINVTLPEPSLPRPQGLLHALAYHAHDRSAQYAMWPQAALRSAAGN